jgi:AcrR family transcriptional regulator
MAATGKKYRTGITTEQIVDAAVELTRQRGLYGWSIRELVDAVDTSPSVVYHRIGGRDAVCRAVVGRVLAQVGFEPPEGDEGGAVDWREWFRARLLPMRPALSRYPGVAKWILMHGSGSDGVDDFDADMDRLRDAGFGPDAALAYALVVNAAMTAIMMSDERVAHEDDDPRDHARIVDELRGTGRGWASEAMVAFIEPLAGDGERARAARDAYYRALVDTVLEGLEQRRLRIAEGRDGRPGR